MSVFNIAQSIIEFEECSFLDMYAGSGIMGLEALSRGFKKSVEIEQNSSVLNILKNNFKLIHDNNSYRIYKGDSLKIVQKLDETFDVIYIDPPYFSGIYEKSLQAVKNIAGKIIILEHIKDIDFGEFQIVKQKKYGDKLLTVLMK